MRLRPLIIAACAAGSVVACGSTASSGGSAAPDSNAITIKNFAFGPAALHVATGTTVTWTNSDSTTHTTTSDKADAKQWDSGNLTPNTSYAVTFTKPGTYSFHCDIHNYMTGTITVGG